MKQLIQNLRDGKTSVVDIPLPVVKPNTALVKTAYSLVSAGTERMIADFAEKNLINKAMSRPDLVKQVLEKARREGILTTLESVANRLDQPMGLGYSSSGSIIEIGAGLEGFKVGDRVACAGGGYAVHAEYAVVPKNLLTHVPDGVDLESAAFTTVGAIALHGFRLAEPQIGENIAVIGLGLLGLLSVQIARAAGLNVFGIDLDPVRAALCKQLGIEVSLREDAITQGLAFTGGNGFDAVLICADTRSNDPVELAGALSRDKGKIIAVGAVGLDIPRKTYYEKELSVLVSRSYGPGRYDPTYEEKGVDYPSSYVRWTEGRNFSAFIALLEKKVVDVQPLISHRFPIEKGETAYQLIKNQLNENYLGVLLTYSTNVNMEITQKRISINTVRVTPGEKTISLGVLGAGNYANAVFLPAINNHKDTQLVSISSGSGLSAQSTARKFRFQYASSGEDDIYENPEINTLAILTRHHLHANQIIKGLEYQKHVFCEKPLAIHENELDLIFNALQANPLQKLIVGYNRRFSPHTDAIMEFFSRRLEPLYVNYRINAGFIPANHWVHDPHQGGGRLIGEVCHFIDLISFLVGSLPISVNALTLPDSGRYNQDNLAITLEFMDGSIGTISYLSNGSKLLSKEYIEVFCEGKVGILDDFRSHTLIDEKRKQHKKSKLRQEKGHQQIWSAFGDSIQKGTPFPIPYEQLWGVAQTTFCAVQSLICNKKVLIPAPPTLV